MNGNGEIDLLIMHRAVELYEWFWEKVNYYTRY